ncbi:MAG: glycosyltransferase [Acidobacteriota bacterium]|nr:glycosyltransferase [Blastocatellia bacterium]MDW8240522.1 glycosyltransferase [Acidobacteriota bacterium]
MKSVAAPKVLYIVYWGAAEPLGQSLVLPAVRRLAALGAELTLVTFEKPADAANRDEMTRIRRLLQQSGVRWVPLRYHKRPKWPATAVDVTHGWMRAILERMRNRPEIIHARTFIGGLIGLALAPVIGAKLVYHNEGFYPDEQVDGGVWRANSMPHRLAKFLEQRMYARADGIIAMSRRGKQVIECLPAVARNRTPVIVVPSCVDLERFRWNGSRAVVARDSLRLIYIGSVGARYLLDKIGRFAAVVFRDVLPGHLRILTKADGELVRSMLAAGGLSAEQWSVGSVPHAAMPEQLAGQHAGLFFLAQGLSEHGCSPTKIGEYWAMGLPVITTPNVSDTDQIIAHRRVGVIVHEHTDAAYRRAGHALLSLLNDPELPERCRQAAEAHYALEPACQRQMELYDHLLSRSATSHKREWRIENGGLRIED